MVFGWLSLRVRERGWSDFDDVDGEAIGEAGGKARADWVIAEEGEGVVARASFERERDAVRFEGVDPLCDEAEMLHRGDDFGGAEARRRRW